MRCPVGSATALAVPAAPAAAAAAPAAWAGAAAWVRKAPGRAGGFVPGQWAIDSAHLCFRRGGTREGTAVPAAALRVGLLPMHVGALEDHQQGMAWFQSCDMAFGFVACSYCVS